MCAGLRRSAHSMFENLFKKSPRRDPAAKEHPDKPPTPSADDGPLKTNAKTVAGNPLDPMRDWREKLLAAGSDDAAILQLAYKAPTAELKLAALQALTEEDSFAQAMREFRDQDKRLYRAAKSRWEAARDRRITTAEANAIITDARSLLQQEPLPANRLVELERRWSALNGELLDAALSGEFAELRENLGAKVRAHGEHARSLAQWLTAVDRAIESLRAILPGVAQGDIPPTGAETPAVALLNLLQSVPQVDDARCSEKTDKANRQLALASSVAQRAEFLQSLPASDLADPALEKAMIEQWRAFPELPDASEDPSHGALAQRFANWRNACAEAHKHQQDQHRSQERAQVAQKDQQRLDSIQRQVETAEAAHGAGRVAELAESLTAIDRALKRGPVDAALAQRIEFLRREHVRLLDWQRWSGEQGREQLVAEAQELARQATGNVTIRAHGEAISKLRERWKELDKLGGASNQSLWLSFDGALKSAYEPVALHLDKLKQARQENLAARDRIIADLAVAAAKFFPPAQEDATSHASAQPDWRAIVRTLEQARIAWQKLGPVEHTVPREALRGENAVTTRYAAAVQTFQAPLQSAYDDGRRQREQLIGAATDLGKLDVSARDVVDRARQLQTQWQSVAKALPLPRSDENALWAAFKSATDAVFTARDASRFAKEAESNAQLAAREEIIERLASFTSSDSASDIKRALADAGGAWRSAAGLPKPLQTKLDARYDAARNALTRRIGELSARAAEGRFDALIAAIALCHEREVANDLGRSIGEAEAADLHTRWTALTHLPNTWKAALDGRFRAMAAPSENSPSAQPLDNPSAVALLDALLNLEVACDIDSPADFLAARKQLRMRALKAAMEGRQGPAIAAADIERWLLEAASYPRPDAQSRERLAKIISVIRRGGLI